MEKCSITSYTTFLLSCLKGVDFTEKRVCDFGCGTGVIGLNIRTMFNCEVIGLDIVPEAIQLSRDNALRNRLGDCQFHTVKTFRSNPTYQTPAFKFDYIISNPASIPSPPSVEQNPFINGGIDGDLMIVDLIQLANSHLAQNGQVIFLHTSLAPLHKTLRYLDESGYEVCIEELKQLEFRSQYKPCEQHLECFREKKMNFFFENRGKRYELVYFIRLKKVPI